MAGGYGKGYEPDQTSVSSVAAAGLDGIHFDTSFPSTHKKDELFFLETDTTLLSYTQKVVRIGEDSASETEFANNEIFVGSGIVIFAIPTADASAWTSLGTNDEIHIVPDGGTPMVLDLSASPSSGTRNNVPMIILTPAKYSGTVSIADGTSYTIYAMKQRAEKTDAIFKGDGTRWTRVIAGREATSGAKTTFGTSFPANPVTDQVFVFIAAVNAGLTWKDTDGSTDLTSASNKDVAQWTGSQWQKRTNFGGSGSSGITTTYGTAYPATHSAGDRLILKDNVTSLERYTLKVNRTCETNTAENEFAATEFGVFNGSLVIPGSQAERSAMSDLGANSKFYAVPASGTTVTFSLTNAGTASGSRNSIACFVLAGANFTQTGTLQDGVAYTIYAVHVGAERQKSVFQSDGNYWTRISTNATSVGLLEMDTDNLGAAGKALLKISKTNNQLTYSKKNVDAALNVLEELLTAEFPANAKSAVTNTQTGRFNYFRFYAGSPPGSVAKALGYRFHAMLSSGGKGEHARTDSITDGNQDYSIEIRMLKVSSSTQPTQIRFRTTAAGQEEQMGSAMLLSDSSGNPNFNKIIGEKIFNYSTTQETGTNYSIPASDRQSAGSDSRFTFYIANYSWQHTSPRESEFQFSIDNGSNWYSGDNTNLSAYTGAVTFPSWTWTIKSFSFAGIIGDLTNDTANQIGGQASPGPDYPNDVAGLGLEGEGRFRLADVIDTVTPVPDDPFLFGDKNHGNVHRRNPLSTILTGFGNNLPTSGVRNLLYKIAASQASVDTQVRTSTPRRYVPSGGWDRDTMLVVPVVNNYYIQSNGISQADMNKTDKIVFKHDDGDVTVTFSADPHYGGFGGWQAFRWSPGQYSISGTFVNNRTYTAHFLETAARPKGDIFRWLGDYYEHVYTNTLAIENIPDDLITLAKLAHGTAGKLLGFNSSGAPAEIDPFLVSAITDSLTSIAGADSFVVSDESVTGDPNKKITFTDLVTAIVAAMSALEGNAKFSYNNLRDRPSIPSDTTIWRGNYAINTAYDAGDMVVHSNKVIIFTAAVANTNTQSDPLDVTGAEQLDVGAGTDIVNVTGSGNTLTITKRDGTTSTIAVGVANGSVTTIKIADNAVTGPKVASNSIDSRHYVDGSIDTEHYGNNSVTLGKMQDSVMIRGIALPSHAVPTDTNMIISAETNTFVEGYRNKQNNLTYIGGASATFTGNRQLRVGSNGITYISFESAWHADRFIGFFQGVDYRLVFVRRSNGDRRTLTFSYGARPHPRRTTTDGYHTAYTLTGVQAGDALVLNQAYDILLVPKILPTNSILKFDGDYWYIQRFGNENENRQLIWDGTTNTLGNHALTTGKVFTAYKKLEFVFRHAGISGNHRYSENKDCAEFRGSGLSTYTMSSEMHLSYVNEFNFNIDSVGSTGNLCLEELYGYIN